MPIQLIMFEDRIEIHNPGGLYGRITIDQLGKIQPDTRNPVLASALETLGITENRYSGIPTIRMEMEKYNLRQPEFLDERGSFIVKLYKESKNDYEDMSNDEETNNLIVFCKTPRTRKAICDYLGLNSVTYAIQTYVNPLVEELEIDAYGECEKMTYYNREDQFLRQRLQKEIPILRALIQNLYEELDRKLHLNGAKVPITFGYDTDTLGSYTRRSAHEKEHFHFSLLFIAYGVKNPLSKEDRIDLFKHEYAHYMQYNMQIPEKYKWQAGTHGSAWKYCCSLIGAAPTPYYKAGEALMNHDYDKVLKNRIHDKSVPVRDTYQQLKTAQKKKDEVVQYKLGDAVTHPKFGHGIVEKINQRSGGVHLHIRFDGEVKCIDQKWLSRKKYT